MNAENAQKYQILKQTTEAILEHLAPSLNGGTKKSFYSAVIKKISENANRQNHEKPWTYRMIYNALSGKPVSDELYHAIMSMGYLLDDGHPLLANAKRIEVWAIGNIKPGTVIIGNSYPCDLPSCKVNIIPKNKNHRHCCREHQVKNYNLKKKLERGTV